MHTRKSDEALPYGSPLVSVEGLVKHFPAWKKQLFGTRPPDIQAVNGVSFSVKKGETFGLVGESGCGKSTVAHCLAGLTGATSGGVSIDGVDVGSVKGRDLRNFRRKVQLVPQDPVSSFDPRRPVLASVMEPLVIHSIGDHASRRHRLREILDRVGMSEEIANRYPHELSGGQCQRLAIARALTLSPSVLILDEAVSALDVSVRAAILNLLRELQDDLDLTYIFIGHDLGVVRQVSDRLGVMYLGQIVEQGTREEIFESPLHPYTQALMSAAPIPDPDTEVGRDRIILRGELPHPANPPSGCRFHPRCFVGRDEPSCQQIEPKLQTGEFEHPVACHYPGLRIDPPGTLSRSTS